MSSLFKNMVHKAAHHHVDAWEKYHIDKLPAEKVRRHKYNPKTKQWEAEMSIIKMESKPFDKGAQRQVYRMKKLYQGKSTAWTKLNWAKAPNYVAKCVITADSSIDQDPNNRDKYFEDIKLQYEAAYWAEKFNHSGPPKPIHMMQCFVIEFIEREGSPVMGCERFIDGHDKYGCGFVKHNSNGGYVDYAEHRATPQAYSAFSFYASCGEVMVVDVQGVGDIYTDPQIHSMALKFGDGDLGAKGIALFFATFVRNPVCNVLNLPRFPLSNRERQRLSGEAKLYAETQINGMEHCMCIVCTREYIYIFIDMYGVWFIVTCIQCIYYGIFI